MAGTGVYRGEGTVEVTTGEGATETLHGDAVILASGSVARTIPGFEVDGMQVKCRHVFGAKAIDWRGMWKDAGT